MGKVSKLVGNTLRPSAFHYVMIIAGVLFLFSMGARYYFGGAPAQLDVNFRDRATRMRAKQDLAQSLDGKIYFGDDDSQTHYAERLRDASQIAISLALYTVRERMGEKHAVLPDIKAVLDGLDSSPLKPDTVRDMRVVVRPDGALGQIITPSGAYYVSYRPRPLAFDVLAAGAHGLSDGAIFILRLPDATGQLARGTNEPPQYGAFATVFIAPYANARLPVPFSPPSSFRAAGWSQEPLRSAPFSPAEVGEINRFVNSVSEHR